MDARGAAFPGVNLYVQIGHGRDYAWSATSAGQDIMDMFAVDLCDPNGGTPTKSSDHYVFRGQCLPMEQLTRTNSWSPNVADQTPAGSETLTAQRTKMGLVIARATIGGKPVAYTKLRSTYFHEVDSALGFSELNNPDVIHGPQDFQHAAAKIGYTFNWFYTDNKHIAYFNSGNNPERQPRLDPTLPVRAKFEWPGYNPDINTARLHALLPAPAGHRPGLSDELEQQAGPRVRRARHGRHLYLDLSLAVARRPDQGGDPTQAQDRTARPGQRDGGRGHRRPAWKQGAALRAQGHREDEQSHARVGAQPAARLGADGRSPP